MTLAATVKPLSHDECSNILAAVLKGHQTGYSWLLAHCDDGIVWGKYNTAWSLAHDEYPTESPDLKLSSLQQVRLFNKNSEVLIWRSGQTFLGRELSDGSIMLENLKPSSETQLVVGRNFRSSKEHFSHLEDESGRSVVVPFVVPKGSRYPLELAIKHYYEQDDSTGVVRIAASRLVEIRERKHA